jgi:hypothetical protein
MARTPRTQFYISRLLEAVQTRGETTLAAMLRFDSCPPGERSLRLRGTGVRGRLFSNARFAVCRDHGRDDLAAIAHLEQGVRLPVFWFAECASVSAGVQ